MFCEKCGNKLGDGDKFCMKCGHKVDYNGITLPNTEEKVEPRKEEAQPSSAIVEENKVEETTNVEETAPKEEPVEPAEAPKPEEASTPEETPKVEDPSAAEESYKTPTAGKVVLDQTGAKVTPEGPSEEAGAEETSEKKKSKKEKKPKKEKAPKPEKAKKSGKGGKIAVIILTVIVALLAGALVFLLVSGMSFSDITAKFTGESPTVANYTYTPAEDADEEDDETTTRTTTERTTEAEDDDEDEDEDTGEYYRVSVGRGNRLSFRALPDEDSTKLNRIDNGTRLYITEVRGNWGRTTYGGESGWVCLRKNGDTYCVKD